MKTNFILFVLLLSFLTNCKSTNNTDSPPNIIYILADDLGYGDLGCYGQKMIKTPNLDKMADEGIMFTNHYAGSTVCAPSRCCLMTGLHTGHARIRGNASIPLETEDVTVAELLNNAGYSTALIGKWGLGEDGTTGHPNKKGFDYFFGYLNQIHAHNSYPAYLWRNSDTVKLDNKVEYAKEGYAKGIGGVAIDKKTHSNDLFTSEAVEFINKNKNNPFFLYLAYTLPHANNEAWQWDRIGMETPDMMGYDTTDWPEAQQAHAAMISSLDRYVGDILNLLKENGISENTLVIFTSDNGPHAEGGADPDFFDSNGPFRGHKRDLYEGGIRVPHIAWWPGKISPAQKSDHLSAFWDFLPTACDAADIDIPENTDGISYLPELLGKDQPKHEYLYWEFYEQNGRLAARFDEFKAVKYNVKKTPFGLTEIYQIEKDSGEVDEISYKNPALIDKAESIMQKAHTYSEHFNFEWEK